MPASHHFTPQEGQKHKERGGHGHGHGHARGGRGAATDHFLKSSQGASDEDAQNGSTAAAKKKQYREAVRGSVQVKEEGQVSRFLQEEEASVEEPAALGADGGAADELSEPVDEEAAEDEAAAADGGEAAVDGGDAADTSGEAADASDATTPSWYYAMAEIGPNPEIEGSMCSGTISFSQQLD